MGKQAKAKILVGDARIANQRALDKGPRRMFAAGHDHIVLIVLRISQFFQGATGKFVKVLLLHALFVFVHGKMDKAVVVVSEVLGKYVVLIGEEGATGRKGEGTLSGRFLRGYRGFGLRFLLSFLLYYVVLPRSSSLMVDEPTLLLFLLLLLLLLV